MDWTTHAEVDYHPMLMKPLRASVGKTWAEEHLVLSVIVKKQHWVLFCQNKSTYLVSLSSLQKRPCTCVWYFTCCAGGLESENDYSYNGHKQKCNFATGKVAAYINSSVELPTDENGEKTDGKQPEGERQDGLLTVICSLGSFRNGCLAGWEWTCLCCPKCICYAGEQHLCNTVHLHSNCKLLSHLAMTCMRIINNHLWNSLQFYRKGVSHPWKILCNPWMIDHAVLLVGYGER